MSSRPSSAARFFASSRRSSPPSTSLRSVAVSPPCELWASSMITAQRRVGSVPVPLVAALLGHLEQLARDERELLQRGDDDGHRVLQRLGELPRALVDLLHHAALVLELVDRVLQLLVEHHAVGDHDHAVEDPLVRGVVQRRQPVRQPADGVALAAAGGVLDKVVVPHALASGARPPACAPPGAGGSAGRSSTPIFTLRPWSSRFSSICRWMKRASRSSRLSRCSTSSQR